MRWRIRYVSLVKRGDWAIALNWNFYPGARTLSLYIFRLLVAVELPHLEHRRRGKEERWTTWTAGSFKVTWFAASPRSMEPS